MRALSRVYGRRDSSGLQRTLTAPCGVQRPGPRTALSSDRRACPTTRTSPLLVAKVSSCSWLFARASSRGAESSRSVLLDGAVGVRLPNMAVRFHQATLFEPDAAAPYLEAFRSFDLEPCGLR